MWLDQRCSMAMMLS